MKLYTLPGACSLAPHIVIQELGLNADVVVAKKGTPQWDEVKKLSVNGQVPLLITNEGYPLTEGVAIMQYLADQKPEGNAFPKAGKDRYKALEWMNFLSTTLHKGFGPLWSPAAFSENPDHADAIKAKGIAKIKDVFQAVENRLDNKPFVFGAQMTAVDAYLFVLSSWSKMFGIDLAAYPKLNAFMTTMYQRPSVQAAMKAEGLLK